MNTDVRQGAIVFHVQTEDLGGGSVRLQTLVYYAGQILKSIEKPYAGLAPEQEDAIRETLLRQHRTVIQAIIRGRIQVEPEDVDPATEQSTLVVSPLELPHVGQPVSLLILLRAARSFQPKAGEEIRIRIRDGAGEEKVLYYNRTDAKGFHLAEFVIPKAPGTDLSLHITAGTGEAAVHAAIPVAPSHEAWLEQTAPGSESEPIDLVVSDAEPVMAGHDANLLILARGTQSCRPIAGAEIRILYSEEVDDYLLIHQGTTDDRGIALAEPPIPRATGSRAMLTIEARCGSVTAEVVLPVFIPNR